MYKQNTFSIIIPTRDRALELSHSVRSVLNQRYPNWELIIVDDGSKDNTQEVIADFQNKDKRIKSVKHEQPTERVGAFNTGHKAVTGDWICWLGSDDEYTSIYLDTFNNAINASPNDSIFNCGKIVYHYTDVQTDNFALKKGKYYNRSGVMNAVKIPCYDEHFDSGLLGAGMFIFKREMLEKALPPNGEMPYARNCYEFADLAGIPGYNSKVRTLGNPWGEDYYMIYKLTRLARSEPINVPLYIHYIR
jgi:glycosyltransferase involved in cell wall biosynthesis